jgi:F-type H+-transporting ATPase subunit b
MTKIHFYSFVLLTPETSIEFHPLLLSGGFWTSPTGFPKLVNLIIFLALLYFLLRKPAREFFTQRFKSVRETLERAAREKETALAKMAEIDTRLARLDTELAEIKSQAQQEAQAERERLKAETERDLERIRVTAQREVEAAKQIAMADLREYAATKSVELAEQIIRKELTSEDDARLVRRVGEEMGRVDS